MLPPPTTTATETPPRLTSAICSAIARVVVDVDAASVSGEGLAGDFQQDARVSRPRSSVYSTSERVTS